MRHLWWVLALGCTDVDLYKLPGLGEGPLDNRLALQGNFCTSDPRTLDFPVKILFAVDTSQSMNRTDPTGRRLTAVQEVVEAFLPEPGVEFAIIAFSGATSVLTQNAMGMDGFTRDQVELENAIVRLGIAEQPTDYEGAIATILRVLAADMMIAPEESLARSKYVVIFVSDGLPNPVDPPTNTRSSILELVAEVDDLQRVYRPAEILFHTALVLGALGTGARCTDDDLEGGDQNCQLRQTAADCAMDNDCTWIDVVTEAESLLTAMANAGHGTFRSFPNGEEINFLRIDFTSIRRVFTLKSLVVSNSSARPRLEFVSRTDRIGRAPPDSDGDGLSDEDEALYGTDSEVADTDGDGFGDQLEVRLFATGFDPLDPSDADCTLPQDQQDTDGDGLRDCEERFVGTSKNFVDSDADGLPDPVELRYGTNPAVDDAKADLDFDAARNADEIRGHTEPAKNDAAVRSSAAYRYSVISKRLDELALDDPRRQILSEGRSCYDFRIENVILASTLSGLNRTYVWLGEAPFDDPADYGNFQVACVQQTYFPPDFRDPPYPEVVLGETDFKDPRNFDPERDCTFGSPPVRE